MKPYNGISGPRIFEDPNKLLEYVKTSQESILKSLTAHLRGIVSIDTYTVGPHCAAILLLGLPLDDFCKEHLYSYVDAPHVTLAVYKLEAWYVFNLTPDEFREYFTIVQDIFKQASKDAKCTSF